MEKAKKVEKSTLFGNWVDRIGYPITSRVLPYVAKISFITPNLVTISSFLLYVGACVLIVVQIPYWNITAAFMFVVAYMGDQLDGQLSRYKKMTSDLGDYLDKTLDVLKIYAIMLSVGLSNYFANHNYVSIVLGFTAAFFFTFRYYIKLETVLKKAMADKNYLDKCATYQDVYEKEVLSTVETLRKGNIVNKIRAFWATNYSLLFIDEGEFAFITAVGALVKRLDIVLYIFVVSQIIIALFRWVQRGYQIVTDSSELLKPLRK